MRSCWFCGGSEADTGTPWTRAAFLDVDGEEAWVCGRSRGAYLPDEPDDEDPLANTCRGRMIDRLRDTFELVEGGNGGAAA